MFSWRVLLSVTLILAAARAQTPFALTWSNKTYGPDGPWTAVSVTVGTPGQSIDLYPGASWYSSILVSSLCNNYTLSLLCYADEAGVYDFEQSSSDGNVTDPEWAYANTFPMGGYLETNSFYDTVGLSNGVSVPNVSLSGVFEGSQTYPDGTSYPLEVGYLSMGAPALYEKEDGDRMMYIPSWLYTSGGSNQTPSYSYTMHLGSAANPQIPGSLLLGGYDEARVLGNVTTQSFQSGSSRFIIGLQDIGLGVASGSSPWADFDSKSGLLAQSNDSIIPPVSADIDPTKPYFYFPQSTCDAIAANLPVYFQKKYGLYFWNTTDPMYNKLITSPAYLSFTFLQDSSDTDTLTIRVPFALLNLTLEAPLIANPTPYFPCITSTGTIVTGYKFGRAFLQAAFLGVNYGTGSGSAAATWFLAQAPGPSLPDSSISSINVTDTTIDSMSSVEWADTWASYWTPLSSSSSQSTSSASSKSLGDNGLSAGEIAGISVGSVVGGLLIFGLAFFIFRSRLNNSKGKEGGKEGDQTSDESISYGRRQLGPQMLSDDMEAIQKGEHHVVELTGTTRPVHEVPT
ncbi:hypothetical protein N7462_007617 [Penicillium macrosclerotiorum]|uniref:uncharacterized protein n=1 Tax=Penicillium macrosclerotiorum TaxID=303699 RepID=UPI0025491EE0|nr:uncharacterized protein N7462_007617 [Penicillium macrosclerotiorum]KAJ5679373.1 hypothetical protein N7462_007617 [Penicillium macrosclerotiorum]